ncbi:histidine kinase OS=Lysinibacillus sphaericus OX=1421 GN=LS41612_14785 PE=4 SV=1 [Lysinibacillus sphaericus]
MGKDIEKLVEIETTLSYYAELTDCYMFIDCMMENLPHAIVVAEAFPTKEIGLYEKSVIGKFVFESFEPAVFAAFKHKERSSISRAITQEGLTVEQNVVPLFNDDGQVIAVLIQKKRLRCKLHQRMIFKICLLH